MSDEKVKALIENGYLSSKFDEYKEAYKYLFNRLPLNHKCNCISADVFNAITNAARRRGIIS
jgi:hypothetical protein